MPAVQTQCTQCGAAGQGSVCGYCGGLLTTVSSIEEEKECLEALHQFVQIMEKGRQAELLRNGYLPEHPDVLVTAGVRLIPLCNESETASEPRDSALARLRMIVTKLKLSRRTVEINAAIAQFEDVLSRNRAADQFYTLLGVVLFILAPAAGAAWWFWLR